MIFDVKIDFGTFWQLPLIKKSKFINFFWVCWFLLGKNPSNFVSPVWKLLNPYCHTIAECLYLTLDFAIVFKKSYHVFYSIFIFFLFFSRKVAHHRHFAENLSKVWGVMPRPRDLNEKYEVGKSGRKEMNKDYGSIASLINNEVSRHYKRNLNKVSLIK